MVGCRNEITAQSVHLRQGANLPRVAEVVCILASGQAGAGCRLYRNDPVIRLAPELLAHEGCNQTTQIGTTAGTADDDIRLDAVLIQCRLGFQTDDGLMQQHLVQHAAQHIPVSLRGGRLLHCFGNGAAQASRSARMLLQDLSAHCGLRRGRGGHGRPVGTHNLPAEGLLFVGNLYHIYLAVQIKVRASHGQSGTPLTCAGLGGHALQPLLLCVVCLGNGGIQLVTAAGIVALKLVADLRRCAQLLLQAVCPYQGGGTVHLVKVPDLLGNLEIGGGIVQFLLDQLLAEHRCQIRRRTGLSGCRIQQGCRLVLHIRPQVVPSCGHLAFVQIDFVGNFLCHRSDSFQRGTE